MFCSYIHQELNPKHFLLFLQNPIERFDESNSIAKDNEYPIEIKRSNVSV